MRSASKYQSRSAPRLSSSFLSGVLLHCVLVQVTVQKCWDEPKEHCTEKTVGVFLVESFTDVFLLQERVQKRVCSDVTQKALPKAEAKVETVKKALPSKAKATKKALPNAAPRYKW